MAEKGYVIVRPSKQHWVMGEGRVKVYYSPDSVVLKGPWHICTKFTFSQLVLPKTVACTQKNRSYWLAYPIYSRNWRLIQSSYDNVIVGFEVGTNGQGNVAKHRQDVWFNTPVHSGILQNRKQNAYFIISVKFPHADWLVAIVYKSTDSKSDRRCNMHAFSTENKANSGRIFSMLL